MSASSTTLRLITLLFLLAGILLLRKPVFGQTNVTSPQIRAAHPSATRQSINRVRDNLRTSN